jgi:hypothetical protein
VATTALAIHDPNSDWKGASMSDQKSAISGANIVRSPLFREIYTNVVAPRMNAYDCGITFGYMTGQLGAAALDTIIEEVHVTMSYGEAKFLVEALSKTIAAYEAEFGPSATQALPPGLDEANSKIVEALKSNRLQRGSTG